MATRPNKQTVHVGDRVRIRVAALEIIANVVEDRGYIGADGRHVVHVTFVDEAGDPQRMDWPADEMTVLPRDPATT